jgi:A/G-specific adenine glycosylase
VEIPNEKYAKLSNWCEKEGFLLVGEKEIDYLAKPKLIVNYLNDQGI